MGFAEILARVTWLLLSERRVTYRRLKREFDLDGDVSLMNGRDETRAVKQSSNAHANSLVTLRIGHVTRAFGKAFELRDRAPLRETPLADYCTPSRQVFDAAAIHGALHARRPHDGDRFRPLGMKGHKKLGDYFTDTGVPRWERPEQILVADDAEILWIVGGGVSEAAAVRDSTNRILEIDVSDAAE